MKRNHILVFYVLVLFFSSCSQVCNKANWLPMCESEFSKNLKRLQDVQVQYVSLRNDVIEDISLELIESYYNQEFVEIGSEINSLVDESKYLNDRGTEFEIWKSDIDKIDNRLNNLKNKYLKDKKEIQND